MRRTIKSAAKATSALAPSHLGVPEKFHGPAGHSWDDVPAYTFAAAAAHADHDDEDEAPAAEVIPDDASAPDDALGLYLRQMGAIPH